MHSETLHRRSDRRVARTILRCVVAALHPLRRRGELDLGFLTLRAGLRPGRTNGSGNRPIRLKTTRSSEKNSFLIPTFGSDRVASGRYLANDKWPKGESGHNIWLRGREHYDLFTPSICKRWPVLTQALQPSGPAVA